MPAPQVPAIKKENAAGVASVSGASDGLDLSSFPRHNSEPDLGEKSPRPRSISDLAGKPVTVDIT